MTHSLAKRDPGTFSNKSTIPRYCAARAIAGAGLIFHHEARDEHCRKCGRALPLGE